MKFFKTVKGAFNHIKKKCTNRYGKRIKWCINVWYGYLRVV